LAYNLLGNKFKTNQSTCSGVWLLTVTPSIDIRYDAGNCRSYNCLIVGTFYNVQQSTTSWWFGGVAGIGVECWTCDKKIMGATPGRVAIKWFLLGWLTVCGQVNHLGTWSTARTTQPYIPPG